MTVTMRAAIAIAVLSTACGSADMNSRSWAGTRDTIRGVEVVRNPDRPLLGSDQAGARELWRTANTGPYGLWEGPRRVAVGAGRVYVLDRAAHMVYALEAATGEDVGGFGGEGDGPGELQRPFGIGVLPEGIVVGNAGGPRIDVFDRDGRYQRSLRFQFIAFLMEVLREGPLLMVGFGEDGGVSRLLDLEGEAREFTPPDTSVVDPEIVFADCPRRGPGAPGVLRAYCRRLAFQQLSLDAEVQREVHVDRPAETASSEELAIVERTIREQVEEAGVPATTGRRLVEDAVEDARVKGLFASVRSDASGRAYVLEQAPEVLGGGGATLHVFDPAGRYLARLAFDRRWRDFQVADGHLFALTEEPDLGLTELVAYELSLPAATGDRGSARER